MTQGDHIELWNKCLSIIKDNIGEAQFDTWFAPVKSVDYSDGRLLLSVPSQFFIERIESQYINLLAKSIKHVYGSSFNKLTYTLDVVSNDKSTNIKIDAPKDNTTINNRVQRQMQGPSDPFVRHDYPDIDSRLNPKYTFENYCGSSSNKLALSIGEAIASDPKCKTFNPLLIFGPTGVGTTHLIQAIGIKIKELTPDKRVLYLTSREFESQYTTAVINKQINDFINFYQSIDVLIIDDIQEFAGKQSTQNTFYHIFNHLHQNQKQLILSSDCPPVSLDGIIPRLISRFKWGVTAELFQPDYALRRQVLEKKAGEDGLQIPNDIIDFIANSVTTSVRELEGIISSIIARATFLNVDISIDMAKAVIANAVKVPKREMNFDFIAETIGTYYGIDTDLMYGKSRKREISDPRQILMFLAKKHTKLSSTTIGLKLSRNHATVLHACKTIEERISYDKQLQHDLEEIEKSLYNN